YRGLLEADPGQASAAGSLVRLCERRGDWACAVDVMRRLIAANPAAARDPAAWLALGDALAHAGQDGEAEAAVRKMVTLGDAPRGHFALAGLLARAGRFPEAVDEYRLAEAAGLKTTELYQDLAEAERGAEQMHTQRYKEKKYSK